MNILGKLVFDASSASEIQNLRLQKVTSLPAIENGDVGRLIFNTGTNSILVGTNIGNVLSWVPISTGGDAAALLVEIDRIETALGLNSDGSFNAAAFTGSLADQTSYVTLITTLQSLVTAATDAVTVEVGRAKKAEEDLGTRITTEVGAVSSELAGEVNRATAAEGVLDGRVDTVVTSITTEVNRAKDAEAVLSGRITTEVNDRTTAIGTVNNAITAEVDRATAAEGVLTSGLQTEINRATAAEIAIRAEFNSKIAGLTWEAPVDFMVTNHDDGVSRPVGSRVLNQTTNVIYTVTEDGFDAGEPLVDGAAFFFTDSGAGYVFSKNAVVQFNGAGSFEAGAGLTKNGNVINVVSTSGTIAVTADSIDVSQGVLESITTVAGDLAGEISARKLADTGLGQRIDDETASREAADLAEVTARKNADSALGIRIDGVAANLATEITDRQSDVNAEEGRATAAEAALASRIKGMYFLYTSSAASVSHVVAHNLGQKYCNVTVVDSTDNVVIPESVVFNSATQLTVTFNTAIDCKVIVMGLAPAVV